MKKKLRKVKLEQRLKKKTLLIKKTTNCKLKVNLTKSKEILLKRI